MKYEELMMRLFACNQSEVNDMFNTGVFNTILEAYLMKTLEDCKLDKKTKTSFLSALEKNLDELTASEVLKIAKER